MGRPHCAALGDGLWDVRSDPAGNRIARVIFCIVANEMVLLHAFIKKTQKTPTAGLEIARKRKGAVK